MNANKFEDGPTRSFLMRDDGQLLEVPEDAVEIAKVFYGSAVIDRVDLKNKTIYFSGKK